MFKVFFSFALHSYQTKDTTLTYVYIHKYLAFKIYIKEK